MSTFYPGFADALLSGEKVDFPHILSAIQNLWAFKLSPKLTLFYNT